MRTALLCLLVSLGACDSSPTDSDLDSDTARDPDTDTTTGDWGPTVCGSRDVDGIEEWFPVRLEAHTVWLPDRTSVAPHLVIDEDAHPGWATRYSWDLTTEILDKSDAQFFFTRAGIETDAQAREEHKPAFHHEQIDGKLTQDGNTFTFQATDSDFGLTCQREVFVTHPDVPGFDFSLTCEDTDGVRYFFYNQQAPQYTLPTKCLADHNPLPFPTRWGRVQTRYPDGRVHLDWEGPSKQEELGIWHAYANLWLKTDAATGGILRLDTYKDYATDEITFPVQERSTLTRTPLTDTTWQFYLQTGERMVCERANMGEHQAGPGRPFAMECTHPDKRVTKWIPFNLAYPFGWGSHDAPGGWWSL